MTSDVPLARGLGSSSSIIVALTLGKLNLSNHDKLQLADQRLKGSPLTMWLSYLWKSCLSSVEKEHVSAVAELLMWPEIF